MPNVNVTYAEMQGAATRLTAGEHQINGDLTKLQTMINQLVQGGYVTDTSSKQFEQSYTEFTQGANKMMEGLNGMAPVPQRRGQGLPRDRHPARGGAQEVTPGPGLPGPAGGRRCGSR